jgi:peptide chain release factor 1
MAPQQLMALNREAGELAPVVEALEALDAIRSEAAALAAMCTDAAEEPDLRSMAQEEHAALEAQVPELERELLLRLLPRDEADDRGVILEVARRAVAFVRGLGSAVGLA